MNENASRRTVRTALGAALVALALALIPSAALGVAPQLDSVNLPAGQNHPTFNWTLPTGDKGKVWSDHIVVSTSSEQYAPGTYLAGEFLDRYWASFNTLGKNDTSFTDLKEYKPGTYFVHVAGHDPGKSSPESLHGNVPAPCWVRCSGPVTRSARRWSRSRSGW